MSVHYLPLTVGATLEAARDDAPEHCVVLYKSEGSWRVGWSAMSLEELLWAKACLEHCVAEEVGRSYVPQR